MNSRHFYETHLRISPTTVEICGSFRLPSLSLTILGELRAWSSGKGSRCFFVFGSRGMEGRGKSSAIDFCPS